MRLEETFNQQEGEIEKMKEEVEAQGELLSNYHYASYNKYQDEEKESEYPRLSLKWINKFLCSNHQLYYRTHELNECLYLHFKGFRAIENMDTFINLKVLYIEGNAIKKIQGLDNLVNLVSLYLHQNLIEKIENLEKLRNLYNLNLSENCITKIENLENLPNLSNLLLKRNRIGLNGLEDLDGLKLLKSVTVIDISDNRIEDPQVKEIFPLMSNIRVIYLQGNECIRKISFYRKSMISSLKELRYLDDKPVFEDERRFAEAFSRGGLDEEKKERDIYKKEKQEAEIKRHQDFRDMIEAWKGNTKQPENEEEKKTKEEEEKIKEEERRKLLLKCKSKTQQNENISSIRENEIFEEVPRLEKIKALKEEGYIEYVLNKEGADFTELD